MYKVDTHIDTVKRYGDQLLITITISAVIKHNARLPISSPIFGTFVFPFPRGIPVGIPRDCESTSLPHGGVIPADRVQITDEYAGRVIGTAPATAAALSDSWRSCTRRAAPPGERTSERANEIYKPNDMTQYDSFACTSRSALQRRFCCSLHATETIRRPLRTDSFIPRANRPLLQILPTLAALCFFTTDYTECSLGEWWGAGVVICLERGADLHTTQLMTLPLTVYCSSKIQIGFTFLVPAYPGCSGKEAVKSL